MNDHDKENLRFILTASEEVLYDWWDKISDDDKDYAQELLRAYRRELVQLEVYYKELTEQGGTGLGEAKAVLKKFTLRG